MDLEQFKQISQQKQKENQLFLKKLKKKKPKDLDYHFHELHEEVFEEVDCLTCANCCKTTSPIFTNKDIERLAKVFKMKFNQFVDEYLYLDEEHDYVLKTAPCPFLGNDNYCLVYDERPQACREYPHTDRRKMIQILSLTQKNTKVCPAVLEIIDRMKQVYDK